MTHAEFLREWIAVLGGETYAINLNREDMLRFECIIGLLDSLQWRDEPPDTPGWWLRDRNHPHWERYLLLQIELQLTRQIHLPGDLWLKLPEDKR